VGEAEGVLRTANQWLTHGRRVCLATVITRQGSAPREVGAKMAISDSGETVGSVGGGGLELEIVARAKRALEDGKAAVVEFDLSGKGASPDALCGGKVSVFIEPLGETRRLFVIGAGHVGRAIARMAHWVGFAVTVVDDREDLLGAEALGKGIAGVCASPDAAGKLGVDSTALVVVCTRGHALDKDWLRMLAGVAPRYVGMLGSREKARQVAEDLVAEGIAADFVSGVHTPVGIAIEAETPEEIAVSVVAELILEWRRGKRGGGRGGGGR
jgi:xanthine dehydrogenase accessory factor